MSMIFRFGTVTADGIGIRRDKMYFTVTGNHHTVHGLAIKELENHKFTR